MSREIVQIRRTVGIISGRINRSSLHGDADTDTHFDFLKLWTNCYLQLQVVLINCSKVHEDQEDVTNDIEEWVQKADVIFSIGKRLFEHYEVNFQSVSFKEEYKIRKQKFSMYYFCCYSFLKMFYLKKGRIIIPEFRIVIPNCSKFRIIITNCSEFRIIIPNCSEFRIIITNCSEFRIFIPNCSKFRIIIPNCSEFRIIKLFYI